MSCHVKYWRRTTTLVLIGVLETWSAAVAAAAAASLAARWLLADSHALASTTLRPSETNAITRQRIQLDNHNTAPQQIEKYCHQIVSPIN